MKPSSVSEPDRPCHKETRLAGENDLAFKERYPSFRCRKRAAESIETYMRSHPAAGSAGCDCQHIASRSRRSGLSGKSQCIDELAHCSTASADRIRPNRSQIERALSEGIAHPRALRISAAIWSTWI